MITFEITYKVIKLVGGIEIKLYPRGVWIEFDHEDACNIPLLEDPHVMLGDLKIPDKINTVLVKYCTPIDFVDKISSVFNRIHSQNETSNYQGVRIFFNFFRLNITKIERRGKSHIVSPCGHPQGGSPPGSPPMINECLVTIWTGPSKSEHHGTKANVYFGIAGQSVHLNPGPQGFEHGSKHFFQFSISPMSEQVFKSSQITLSHDNSDDHPGWYVLSVKLQIKYANTADFLDYGTWSSVGWLADNKSPYSTSRKLQ